MISEAIARKRTLIAIVACLAAAALVANVWVDWIYPSCFTGEAYSNFKFYPHGLFLPATLGAMVLGKSESVFHKLLFIEAFLICFGIFIILYGFIAYVYRRGNS